MNLVVSVLFGALFAVTPVSAAPPDVNDIVKQMKQVFEPDRPSTRTLTISANTESGDTVTWVARQVRQRQTDGKRSLLVMQEPQHEGNALLIWERAGEPDVMWWYPPALRRVRKLVPVENYQRFMDTDFTYADLGFVDRHGSYRLLGEEVHDGVQTYKIELVPRQQAFFSRIVTWVAKDTMLPLQRDYYDVAGRLWKTMTFREVKVIDNIPTPLQLLMRDAQQGTSTEITFSDVTYDADIPETFFDPEHLPQTVEARFWQEGNAVAAKGK
jgi:outer membrane lipoprotein-sorting protein